MMTFNGQKITEVEFVQIIENVDHFESYHEGDLYVEICFPNMDIFGVNEIIDYDELDHYENSILDTDEYLEIYG